MIIPAWQNRQPAGAAPEDLDVEAVVHDLDERHELVLRVRPVGEVGDRALVDDRGDVGVLRGDRDDPRPVVLDVVHRRARRRPGSWPARAAPLRGCGRPAALPRAEHLGDLADRLLAVADHERVDEVGERLGVERAVAAGDHERVLGRAGRAAHRDAGEIDAVQDVRVDELGREVEREDVEVAGRPVGVDREQRHPAGPQLALEVDPGRVGALGDGIVAFVEDLVEDLQPLVGEADLVGVGVQQQPGDLVGPVLRPQAASLHPDVAGGLLHPGQERFDPRPQVGHLPDSLQADRESPVGRGRSERRERREQPSERPRSARDSAPFA